MEGKKISFGFMKTKKAEKPVVEEKREYIECLEEKSIKVVGGDIQEEKSPLVIPMKPNTLVTAERLKQIADEVESGVYEIGVKEEPKEAPPVEKPLENESLEQQAVRELLQESKKEIKVEKSELTVPVKTDPPLTGQKESTLDDYESVPIQDFGLAMLRGMGWTPGQEKSKYKEPQLRPKGLGLGADKVVKQNQKKPSSNNRDDDKELMIVKNAFVKITCGKYSGFYGKVLSLDEDNGRVMVDITVKKETVSLSEFMMQPVTKSEYDKQSKVINADKYEEYKNNEKQQSYDSSRDKKQSTSRAGDIEDSRREERSRSDDIRGRDRREDSRSDERRRDERRDEGKSRKDVEGSNGRNREAERKRRSSSNSSQERNRKHRKYSSNDSLSSDSERKKKSKHKKHKREKNSSESSDSDSSDSYSKKKSKKKKHKRDIDKKRKGKKKKRDRDRSPNYKKYRK